jgi:PAS domain S-box-containing protein
MPRWREVTGQSPDELLGLGWLAGVHPDDRPRVATAWRAAVEARGVFATAYRIVGPDRTVHLDVRGAPVIEDGEVVEWIGWAADVTDRERTRAARTELERTLAGERRALEHVVDQAPAAIAVLWGPQHTFRFVNRRYEQLIPGSRALRGRTVAEALPEAAAALPLLDRAFAGEEVDARDFAVAFEGGHRFYDFTYSPIIDEGRTAGVLVIAVETTDEVNLRAELQRRLGEERELAEQLQRAMLPQQLRPIDGLDVAVRYLPAAVSGVGGDWYDALPLADGRALLVIGDVAGRGLPAATAMAQLRAAVRAYAVEGSGPADVLHRLSRYCLTLGLADFVTAVVAVVDPAAGRLTWASAGHPPLLHLPGGGAPPEFLWQADGPPIGAPTPAYETATVELVPGATVVLYTDGLVEERTRSLDETLEDLRRAAGEQHADLDALCDRLVRDRRQTDDTALLACRRTHVPVAPALERRFPAEAVAVSAVRAAVAEVATACGFDDDHVGRIKLAVSEAATNAVMHAYRDAPAPGELAVRAEVRDGELRVVVADDGAGIRPREDSPGLGLGLGLMSALTTRVDFVSSGGGTEVHLAWHLTRGGASAARPAPG